jgi:hypothetical protein
MRPHLSFLVLVLVSAAWIGDAVAAVTVSPGQACPSGEAIATRLKRLGVFDLLSQLGAAEVQVDGPSLRLHFRDRQGDALGDRVVTAPTDCEARAALASAVIAAFAGEWAQTALAPPAAAAAKAVAKEPVGQPWQGELGALAFVVHDGDQGGLGAGVRADLGRGAWLLSALFEGSSEREQPLGSGQGGYRFLRAGLGIGVRQLWSGIFWDATLVPMVDRLSLTGKDHPESNLTVTSWGFAVAGQTRLGWAVGRLRPFLFLGASYRVPGERMTLLDRPDRVPLSAFNIEAGLGISFKILP